MATKEYHREYYLKNRDRLIERAKRYQKENRLQANAKNRAWKARNADAERVYARQYYRDNKEARQGYHLNYKKNNPERMRAKSAVANWVRAGKLVRPGNCSICNKSGCRVVAHHEDYSRPYGVDWLCDSCHKLIHSGELVLIKC